MRWPSQGETRTGFHSWLHGHWGIRQSLAFVSPFFQSQGASEKLPSLVNGTIPVNPLPGGMMASYITITECVFSALWCTFQIHCLGASIMISTLHKRKQAQESRWFVQGYTARYSQGSGLKTLFIFTYLAAPGLTCDTWDLHSCLGHAGAFGCSMQTLDCSMQYPVPWPGIKPRPSALGVWSLNPWTTRKVPKRHPFWMSVRSWHVFFPQNLAMDPHIN